MRSHQLKMNPAKSFLGVSSGKFLGFVVTSKEIHLDPEKISAIRDMEPPQSLKELRGLQGKMAYIRRFISNLSGCCQPFSKLMRKGVTFVWDQACQDAFDEIKHYLTTPPVLVPPPRGKPSSSMCDQWNILWEPYSLRKVTKVMNKLSITLVEL